VSSLLIAVIVLLAIALLATERTLRPGHPLGFPSPTSTVRTARCQRCGRTNLEADAYGRVLPHYPHTRAPYLCAPRRIH
jgi:hypothetical protein